MKAELIEDNNVDIKFYIIYDFKKNVFFSLTKVLHSKNYIDLLEIWDSKSLSCNKDLG